MGSAVFFVNSDCGMQISSFRWLVRKYSKKGTQRKCFAKNWEAHKVERKSRQGCESGVNTWIFFLHRVRHDICPTFYTTGFSNQQLKKCVICNIVCSLENSANAFSISYFIILDRNELDYKKQIFEENKHKLMNELKISVLITREIMLFLDKFTPLTKILHCCW